MTSSLPTLERIVANDKVDDDFRQRQMRGTLTPMAVASAIGAGGAYYCISDMVGDGVGIGGLLFSAVSLVTLAVGITGVVQSVSAWRRFRAQKADGYQNPAVENSFYYLAGKVSPVGTVVEKFYGTPILPASSLRALVETTHCEKLFGSIRVFLDRLAVDRFEQRVYEERREEGCGTHDDGLRLRCRGSMRFRRLEEELYVEYDRPCSMKTGVDVLKGYEGREFAMLFTPLACITGGTDRRPGKPLTFLIDRIYCPHP